MSSRKPVLLLTDIIESAQKIKNYTVGLSYQQFINDDKTKDAVIRNFKLLVRQQTDYQTTLKIDFQMLTGRDYGGLEKGLFMITWELTIQSSGELLNMILMN